MSKLAAICAKLKGGAVTVTDNQDSPFNPSSGDEKKDLPFFLSEQENVDMIDETSQHSVSLERGDGATPTDSMDTSYDGDSSIGVLKRKSIMPLSSGASRRKRQRPSAAVSNTQTAASSSKISDWQSTADDNQSMDGSEHSLHIDLPEEKSASAAANSKSPFQQYTRPGSSSSQHNPGVLQALGLTGFPNENFGSIMASQSLAALAQQASSFKVEEMNQSRAISPSSLSGDSLNDSNSRASLADKLGSNSNRKVTPLDYGKYLTRYASAKDCGSSYCAGMNYREHFHCLDCASKMFVKKEEMIRHYKWHKKREDSLQHGFMRYSPFDDCSVKFGACAHNMKQTHYHCIQAGCHKVYVSTSDVQMHANYHRKASAIIMEGFQRFRATEDCGTPSCDFYSQRTTHFHCRRQACNFTFKNKADMEKHKTYHQKDEILAKDGFKKYMKYENCPYQGCAYSKLSNHIHCMRPGCQYVLHSTSQLYPHKRKHEKKDCDLGYSLPATDQKLPLHVYTNSQTASDQSGANNFNTKPISTVTTASDLLSTVAMLSQGLIPMALAKEEKSFPAQTSMSLPTTQIKKEEVPLNSDQQLSETTSNDGEQSELASDLNSEQSNTEQVFDKSLNLTPGRMLEPAAMNWKTERCTRLNEQAKSMMGHFKISGANDVSLPGTTASSSKKEEKSTELWKKYLTRYTANDPCNPRCWLLYKDHYHCNVEKCFNAFKSKDGVRDHARLHDNQEKVSEQLFNGYQAEQECGIEDCEYSAKTQHFHCKWMGCKKIIPLDEDIFARLDHFQEHELAARINLASSKRNASSSNSPKSLNKKRGRPPKNMSTVPHMLSDDLRRAGHAAPRIHPKNESQHFNKFDASKQCSDDLCIFRQEKHYHCMRERCHVVTNRLDVINLHSINFHKYIQIPENYAYFDRNVNCRGVHCSNNRNSCHYHCLRPGCEHSFIRHTTVAQHDKRHKDDMAKSPKIHQKQYVKFAYSSAEPSTSGAPGEQPVIPAQTSPVVSQHSMARELSRMAELSRTRQPITENGAAYPQAGKTVKAAGTFFPQAGKPEESSNGDDASSTTSSSPEETAQSSAMSALGAGQYNPTQNNQATAMLNLLTQMLLIQQKAAQAAQHTAQQQQQQRLQQEQQQQQKQQQQASEAEKNDAWQKMLGRMYASPQLPCGNVFCKKKQVEHYHCLECSSAFNKAHAESRLKSHMARHAKYADQFANISVPESHPAVPARMSTAPQTSAAGDTDQTASISSMLEMLAQQQSLLRKSQGSSDEPAAQVAVADSSTEHATSASNIQEMMMKALQLQVISNSSANNNSTVNNTTASSSQEQTDQSYHEDSEDVDSDLDTPDMYKRYSKAVDCGYPKCSNGQSDHYHCMRDECTYSVSTTEQSKLAQHTTRHEKLDKVMGDDFKLYKARSDCGRADCEFSSKASHFHCLLCPYICTDANRIMPHRKNHMANKPTNTSQSSALGTVV